MASPNVSEIVTTTIDQMASIVHGIIGSSGALPCCIFCRTQSLKKNPDHLMARGVHDLLDLGAGQSAQRKN